MFGLSSRSDLSDLPSETSSLLVRLYPADPEEHRGFQLNPSATASWCCLHRANETAMFIRRKMQGEEVDTMSKRKTS
jgi:hypothetical protein